MKSEIRVVKAMVGGQYSWFTLEEYQLLMCEKGPVVDHKTEAKESKIKLSR